jgi:hypothetical protein
VLGSNDRSAAACNGAYRLSPLDLTRRKIHKAVAASERHFRIPKAKSFGILLVPSAMVSRASLQQPIAKLISDK